MKRTICLLCLFPFVFLSCEKITYYKDKPVNFVRTMELAHRGGGNDSLRDNNYESCVAALAFADGLEVDVQISKDHTIWLSHSSTVVGCAGEMNCFAETYDHH